MALLRHKKIIIPMLVFGLFSIFGVASAQTSGSSVDIIWEANSYTPPFYMGKGLKVGPQDVKFVAFPEIYNDSGNRLATSNLYYEWSLNGKVIGRVSGINQKSVLIATSLRTDTISVSIMSPDLQILYATGQTRVENSDPEVVVYREDPLLGVMFNKSIDTEDIISGGEISLMAYPYYFSVSNNRSSFLEYLWTLNGRDVSEGVGKSNLILQLDGNGGSSLMSVIVSNNRNVFQDLKYSFGITLEE